MTVIVLIVTAVNAIATTATMAAADACVTVPIANVIATVTVAVHVETALML